MYPKKQNLCLTSVSYCTISSKSFRSSSVLAIFSQIWTLTKTYSYLNKMMLLLGQHLDEIIVLHVSCTFNSSIKLSKTVRKDTKYRSQTGQRSSIHRPIILYKLRQILFFLRNYLFQVLLKKRSYRLIISWDFVFEKS